MRIAVCDDRIEDSNGLINSLREALRQCRLKGEVAAFLSGEQLLSSDVAFQIYFLDIYMAGISGVETAKMIKQKNPDALIVFTTSSPDHMADGFDIGVVHYLLKPFTQDGVITALERCFKLIGSSERYIEFTVNRAERRILYRDILFMESHDKSCLVHIDGEDIRVYLRLDELERELDDSRFLRCHRSYLINLEHAQRVDNNDFVLTGGKLVPIRRGERINMKNKFEEYCFDKTRRGNHRD